MPGLLWEGRVTANGLRFAYLEGGSGPLVLLLHGWPDTPHTWDYQLAALAGAGFRVAAPWLRGYPPTEIPRSGYFDIDTLAVDVRELIRVLGGGDPCLLVGQDWGASIGYQVLAAFPEVVRSAVVMAVPHPAATRESLLRRACSPVLPLVLLPAPATAGAGAARGRLRVRGLAVGLLDRARLHR